MKPFAASTGTTTHMNCEINILKRRNRPIEDISEPEAPLKIGEASRPVRQAYEIARKFYHRARSSHDWDHSLRVYNLCERIGENEGADMTTVRIAALLHDIGRHAQDVSRGAICHARHGARMAGPAVRQLPISEDQRENVIHCIQSHRFRGTMPPRTLEARVLYDADKLDAIGAVGVARAFLFAGEVGARLHSPEADVHASAPYSRDDTGFREFKVKLCRIREKILTAEGRRIADQRHEFMELFFKRFLEEYEGKR